METIKHSLGIYPHKKIKLAGFILRIIYFIRKQYELIKQDFARSFNKNYRDTSNYEL